MIAQLTVDTDWVWEQLEVLGKIGATPEGGRTRLAYTPEDEAGRAYVADLMRQSGMQVREDPVGNLFGRLEGREPGYPALLVGSHVDTVPNAGRLDGCLGVLAAIETVRTFNRAGITPLHPIEVVAFMGEESSRFGLALIGSRAFAGTLPPNLERYVDKSGISLAQVLHDRGVTPEQLAGSVREPGTLHAYLELHIEQGSYLVGADKQIGVVTGIAAPTRMRIVVRGEAAHSGASTLDHRKDALMGAAQVLAHVEDLVRREQEWGTIATVGQLTVWPNSMNVVPGEVAFSLDVRGVEAGSRRRLSQTILRTAARVATERGLELQMEMLGEDQPVPLPERMQAILADACEQVGATHMAMPSMAGHDAMQVARLCPTGMVLVRNVSQVSHSPLEDLAPEDCGMGVRALAEATRRLAEGPPLGT